MNKILKLLLFVAIASSGLGEPVVVFEGRDSFNDGKRDRQRWLPPVQTLAALVESEGGLHFLTENQIIAAKPVVWIWAQNYPVSSADRIVVTAKVRAPAAALDGVDLDASVYMGIGLRDPRGDRVLTFGVNAMPFPFGRKFYFNIQKPFTSGFGREWDVPVDNPALNLKLVFRTSNNTLTLWWKRPNDNAWTRIGPAYDMAARWSPPANMQLTPFLHARSYLMPVHWSDKFILDDFAVWGFRE